MTTTLAVIQARSGSTRFPRKVLAPLQGRPVLVHIIDRVRRATLVDGVVVATTVDPHDDDVASLALASGASVSRGPEDDVLTRYVLAAREHAADVVVRITADCPLADPEIVDLVIRAREDAGADYASNVAPATYPDGYDVEALTAACLFRLDAEATLRYEREHVTVRVREHLDHYRTVDVRHDPDLSWMRLTVDLPEDLHRIARLLASLPETPPPGLAAVAAAYGRDWSLHGNPVPPRDYRWHAQRDAERGTPSSDAAVPRTAPPSLALVGRLVRVRPISLDDCTERYVNWLRDPDVNKYLETRWLEQTLESVRAFVVSVGEDSASHLMAITDAKSDRHIGNIKIGPISSYHNHADLSYFIGDRDYWGRGYATEAIQLAIRLGFEQFGLHRLQAGTYASNSGSARALEKAGFIRDAVMHQKALGPSGWEDQVWYRLLKEEWNRP